MWQKALAIAAARAGEHTQRAASPADYHLTGLITCPDCVHSYVGTSATGRTRTYRYYTCLSRARYGPGGCPAPRLPAGETDAAVLQALCDFYANSTELIQDAVTRAQQRHRDGHASQRAEHAAILARSSRRRTRSTATTPRSRTAPWTTPPPASGSRPCTARSPSSPSEPTTSPKPSVTSPHRRRPA